MLKDIIRDGNYENMWSDNMDVGLSHQKALQLYKSVRLLGLRGWFIHAGILRF